MSTEVEKARERLADAMVPTDVARIEALIRAIIAEGGAQRRFCQKGTVMRIEVEKTREAVGVAIVEFRERRNDRWSVITALEDLIEAKVRAIMAEGAATELADDIEAGTDALAQAAVEEGSAPWDQVKADLDLNATTEKGGGSDTAGNDQSRNDIAQPARDGMPAPAPASTQEEDLIQAAIVDHWGEKCRWFDAECSTCRAWRQYDNLRAAEASLDAARKERDEAHEALAQLGVVRVLKSPDSW